MGRLAVHIQRLSVLFHHLRFRLLLGGGQQADGLFVGAEHSALHQHLIDQRRLAVIDVGYDCDIS